MYCSCILGSGGSALSCPFQGYLSLPVLPFCSFCKSFIFLAFESLVSHSKKFQRPLLVHFQSSCLWSKELQQGMDASLLLSATEEERAEGPQEQFEP